MTDRGVKVFVQLKTAFKRRPAPERRVLRSLAVYGLLGIVYLSLVEPISSYLNVAQSHFARALELNRHAMLITTPYGGALILNQTLEDSCVER